MEFSHLDPRSQYFDPVVALRSGRVNLPVPDAKPRDNILKCRTLLPLSHPLAISPSDESVGVGHGRATARLDKHRTAAVLSGQKGGKKDIMSDMMDQLNSGGPFSWLHAKVAGGGQVRVVTRHRRGGVRGEAIGKLVAFDRHMNLVLRDVQENYGVRLLVDKQTGQGGHVKRPVLERRRRTLPNVLLTGRSIVLLSDSP